MSKKLEAEVYSDVSAIFEILHKKEFSHAMNVLCNYIGFFLGSKIKDECIDVALKEMSSQIKKTALINSKNDSCIQVSKRSEMLH